MNNLIDMIQEFGNLSHSSGVHEREDEYLKTADAAEECFKRIIRHIGQHNNSPDAISVPCPKCVVCEESANRYCYNCGRKLSR